MNKIIDLHGKSDKEINEMLFIYLDHDLREIGEIGYEKRKK